MKAPPRQTSAPTTPGEHFNELVHRYQDAAFAYAYAILKDRSAAEDATQTAFLAAWIHFRSRRDLAAFGGWLRKIVQTECLRIVRTDRLRTVPFGDAFVEPHIQDANVELRLSLLEAIASLRTKDRVAISLRYLSDLSYQEMADFLLEPVSTVKKRLHGARRRLRAGLESLTAQNVREWRPSTHARLEDRIVTFTAFLETVVHGEVADVETALDAHPEFLTAQGGVPRFAMVSASALWLAAMSGREPVVKLLLARGADRQSVSAGGVSPVAVAAVEGRQHIVQLLVDNGFETDIFAAAALGDVHTVRALLGEKFVAPGFINIHSHAAAHALPHAENMLTQGVTTEILNPDGSGPVDIAAQMALLAAPGLAVNSGAYVGFNSVWRTVVGSENRRPTAEDINRMRGMIVEGLEQGAWGVSAGLDYTPAVYAKTAEVITVVEAALKWRTNFPNHERLTSESNFSSQVGITETLAIAEAAGLVPVITHMKAQGPEQGTAPALVAKMARATRSGSTPWPTFTPTLPVRLVSVRCLCRAGRKTVVAKRC